MTTPTEYVLQLKARLVTSPVVASFTFVVEHYPDLPNFPHHVHVGKEENVEPGERLSLIQLLDVLASEIPNR